MENDIELLEFICENAEMGKDSLSHLLEKVEDVSLRETLEDHLRDYQDIYNRADELLKETGRAPDSAGAMAKTMAHMMTDFKTMTDDSPSRISEMVIKGNNMGITKMTQHLNDYDGQNKQIAALAKRHITNLERNINDLKAYL